MESPQFLELPLSEKGRKFLYINLIVIILLIVIPIISLLYMPNVVPVHWNAEGQVTSYSTNISAVIILATVMPLANIIIVIVTIYRWKLVNKYPYIINLPAITLVMSSSNLDQQEKSEIVNKIFEVTLLVGITVGAYLLGLEIIMIDSMITGYINNALALSYSIIGALLMIIPIILLYRRIYKKDILPKIRQSP
ncbi:MAG: DUF1648 domain-containing protein [Desulfurococcales archaeon]|nr:DUF1648 domain-containing protein [Desulfurococcales archaeon]